MRGFHSGQRERIFRAGMRSLARHDSRTALRLFRAAVDSCPANRKEPLARYLYWLSIPLLRLGRTELALKSLVSAQKLAPRGPARDLYKRIVNGYGMVSTGCEDTDDFRAFFSIQLRRYLRSRPGGRFRNDAEGDAVARIIADAWLSLKKSHPLPQVSCSDKLDVFRSFEVAFPLQFLSKERVLQANFRRGVAQRLDERCSCGSGLPYRQCCGRTLSVFEVRYGSF